MQSQVPSDRQLAIWVSVGVALVTAFVTFIAFWGVYYLALEPDLDAALAAEAAPYDYNTNIQAIINAEPNVPPDNRQPWLGADAWTTAVQAGQDYITQFPQPQNVQVLSGMDTAQLWNYMQRMSAAMGVSCQYCHDINNYSADSYPQKVSARLMLIMVQDLNSQYMANLPNWRGNYVQCDTCHLGEPIDLPTVSPAFVGSTPPIEVVLEPLNEQGMPVRDPNARMTLEEAALYYYFNYQIWDPFDPSDPTSGRGSLALTYPGGRTQDQVTIVQTAMNSNAQSMGVGCTYCHNSRNFYAYEADIEGPQFTEQYAINRLKAQRMLLMTTFMAQNWNRYVLPRTQPVQVDQADLPLVDDQYYLQFDGVNYSVPACYTCHRGNIVPKAAINITDIPEGDAGVIVFPPVLTGLTDL